MQCKLLAKCDTWYVCHIVLWRNAFMYVSMLCCIMYLGSHVNYLIKWELRKYQECPSLLLCNRINGCEDHSKLIFTFSKVHIHNSFCMKVLPIQYSYTINRIWLPSIPKYAIAPILKSTVYTYLLLQTTRKLLVNR